MPKYPKDGSFVGTIDGSRYCFVGRTPIPVTNWANIGETGPYYTIVDPVALTTYSSSGYYSHVRQKPLDYTYVKVLEGYYYRYISGMKSQVSAYEPSTGE